MGFEGDDTQVSTKARFRYNSPLVQVTLIGLVCFCCPGMFNALAGLGGGGQENPTAANNANTALYTTFAIFGILGGGIYNILGPRLTLASGCSTYVLYAGSFLYYNHQQHQAFAIISGAVLGIGVIGGLIPFILNYNRSEAASVNDGTNIGIMCFMTAGTLLSLSLLPPSKVVRDDGTRCTNIKYSKVSTEAVEIGKLFFNWKMLFIAPAAWASNFVHSYQFNMGLNNVFYWGGQMVGSVGIGYILDFSFQSRRKRGFVGNGIVAALGTAIWAGGLAKQVGYSRNDLPPKLDFKDSGSDFAGPFILYFSYGLPDAMFRSTVYWVIGALADDSEVLSRVQSAGAAVAWHVDARKVPLLTQLIVNWSFTTVSYPLLAILAMLVIKDDHKGEESSINPASMDNNSKPV
ncbi:hypothetical protein POPTR_012G011000v4 [Populus trichocarpa]|uniref:Uncharacterized protein n=1 Tax=Populus trichocarpa TaxID=3694 RepID=A0ACC0S3A5_POPTR|nr:hypothetical protein POPTR_012G011000v4 [Populus trichocarpa]